MSTLDDRLAEGREILDRLEAADGYGAGDCLLDDWHDWAVDNAAAMLEELERLRGKAAS